MNALHDALALIERDAASDFYATGLADDLSPVTSAVRRARIARGTASVSAAFALVVAGVWAVNSLGPDTAEDPAGEVLPSIETADPIDWSTGEIVLASTATDVTVASGACLDRANALDPANFPYSNGYVADGALCLLWDGTTSVRADAAISMVHLNAAFLQETGSNLCLASGYTDSSESNDMEAVLAQSGGADAHAYGLAVDFCEEGGPDAVHQIDWLVARAELYGLSRPELTASSLPLHWVFAQEVLAQNELRETPEPAETLTIRAHTTQDEVAQALAAYYGVSYESALQTLRDGLPGDFGDSGAQGWLAQGAYDFRSYKDPAAFTNDAMGDQISILLDLQVPESEWQATLTLASLIERESLLEVDMALVSRVIHNRLDLGMPLELDSTVLYVTGGTEPFVTDEMRLDDSLYNTYRWNGLPPGPISSPSAAAIQAAVQPAEGTWLFFVCVNLETGEMRFATNSQDHADNVALLQEWYEANDG